MSRVSSRQETTPAIRGRSIAAFAAALLFCVLLGYRRILDAFFVSDDFDIVLSIVRDGPFGIWANHGSGFFRPAFALSIYADHALWGLDPRGYHAVNLLIHTLCSFLVAMIAFLMTTGAGASRRRAEVVAFAAGLLFASLPTHDEPVIWISGRGDLLACLFSLAAILSCFGYLSGARAWSLLATLFATALALLSKESAITLPVLIIASACIHGGPACPRRAANRRAPVVICTFALLVAYLLTRRLILGQLIGGYGASVHRHFDLEVLGKLFAYFPSRILAPALGVVDLRGVAFPLNLVVYALVIAVAAGLLARRRKRLPVEVVFVPLGMMLILLLPVMNLSVVATSSEGTRFLYLPSAMMVLTLVMVLASTLTRRTIIAVTMAMAIPSLAFTHVSSARWVEAGALARRTVVALGDIATGDRLWLLNVPDSLNGAYVFRTGIDSANALFNGGKPVGSVVPVFRHPIAQVGESIHVERLSRGRYALRPQGRAALVFCFSQISDEESGLLQIEDLERNGREVSVAGAAADGVAYWYRGGLRLLDVWPAEAP